MEIRMPLPVGYEGKYDKILHDGNGGGIVEWQPGDGTRYLLIAKKLTLDECYFLSAPGDAYLISVGVGGNYWLTLVHSCNTIVALYYLRDRAKEGKMSVSDYTMQVYAALINLVVGNRELGKEYTLEMMRMYGREKEWPTIAALE